MREKTISRLLTPLTQVARTTAIKHLRVWGLPIFFCFFFLFCLFESAKCLRSVKTNHRLLPFASNCTHDSRLVQFFQARVNPSNVRSRAHVSNWNLWFKAGAFEASFKFSSVQREGSIGYPIPSKNGGCCHRRKNTKSAQSSYWFPTDLVIRRISEMKAQFVGSAQTVALSREVEKLCHTFSTLYIFFIFLDSYSNFEFEVELCNTNNLYASTTWSPLLLSLSMIMVIQECERQQRLEMWTHLEFH
jgi:hypothetical protein